MKKNLLRLPFAWMLILLAGILCLGNFNQLNQANTGAPGEMLCQPCHHDPPSGLTGGMLIQGLPAKVVAGQAYAVTLSVYRGSPLGKRTGFQLTLLDTDGTSHGLLTENDPHVAVRTFGNRQYAQHEPGIILNQNGVADTAKYHFTWTPELVSQATSVQGYFSSILGNGDNTERTDTGFAGIKPVTVIPKLTGMIEVLSVPLCHESNEGILRAVTSGGLHPLAFLWSDGQTSATAHNLPAGFYTVTVTDALGQQIILMEELEAPPALNLDLQFSDASCFESPDGWISMFVSGGTPGYDYYLNGVATTDMVQNLSVGDYQVQVIDAHNCTIELPVTISAPDPLEIALLEVEPQTPQAGGSITIGVAGGTLPYDFVWEGPDNYASSAQNQFNLEAGSYSLTLTDGHDCQQFFTQQVEFSSAILETASNFSCQINANPGTTGFRMVAPDGFPDSWRLDIYSTEGCHVLSQEWHGSLNQYVQVPAEVRSGLYFLLIQGKETGIHLSSKWVKAE